MSVVIGCCLLLLAGCGTEPRRSPTIEERRAAGRETALLVADGRRAFAEGHLNVALARLDSASKLAPDLADVPHLRGLIYAEMQRFDKSRGAFEKVLELDPFYPGASYQLGHLNFREQKYRAALEHYRTEADLLREVRQGHIIVPGNESEALPAVLVQIGRSHAQLVETQAALRAYAEALTLDSTFVPALLDMAQLTESEGAVAEALTYAERAHAQAPNNMDVRYTLGRLYLKSGNLDKAASHLQTVEVARPWDQGAAYNLGRALSRSGRDEQAQRYFARADSLQTLYHEIDQARTQVHQQPTSSGRWMELAAALDRAGRDLEARRAMMIARSFNEGTD